MVGMLAIVTGVATTYKYAKPVIDAVQKWKNRRALERLEGLMFYVDKKASSYALPPDFNESEDFADFAVGVCEVATRTAQAAKLEMLACALLNEAAHGKAVQYDVKMKVLEILPNLRVHHVELLRIIYEHSQVPSVPPRAGQDISEIQDFEALPSLKAATSRERSDLFYSAVSDLLRWFLVRSTTDSGVNIAKVSDFIPGSSNMGFIRTTFLGEQVLEYVRDPKGAFIDFSQLGVEEPPTSPQPPEGERA